MMISLDRINPISATEFDVQFLQWAWVLVDSLNESIDSIEDAFNLLTTPSYTQAQISDMQTAGKLENGVVLYDTTNNVYVGRIAGGLVKFTTAAYP